MRIERKIKYSKKLSIWDSVQYILGLIVVLCFAIGLIPFTYNQVISVAVGLLVIQIIISLVRLRLLNVLLEVILLILSIVSIVPILGYVTRILGILAGLVDMTTFKNYKMYKNIEVRTFSSGSKRSSNNKKKIRRKPEAKDAEFVEK